MAKVSITTPSSEAAAQMGIREWPQQLKKGFWDENVGEGQTLIRYVLDGQGVLEIEDVESGKTKSTDLKPGTLIEVTGDTSLLWKAEGEMIILTPGFEEGGMLLVVACAVVVLFAALIALS